MTRIRGGRRTGRGCPPLRVAALAAAALLAAWGCAPDAPVDAEWAVTVDTLPGGVVHVVNTPPASGIEPTWTLEPEVRIGSVEGDGPETFGQVKGFAALPDGRIAVLDAQAQEIRIFGPDGRHVRTLGRRVYEPTTAFLGEGDTLLVVESRRPPLPVAAAERDSAIAAIRERVEQPLDWSRIPGEKPIVQGMVLDDAGRIWVQVLASDTTTTYDVFGRDGRYRGTAVLPLRVQTSVPPVIVDDRFLAHYTDELGVPYVLRARIEEVGPGGAP